MPKHRSALKRLRQSKVRNLRNRARKRRMKTAIKKVLDAASEKRDPQTVGTLYRQAVSIINKTASQGTIHRNTASRKVSRLTAALARELGQNFLAATPSRPAAEPSKPLQAQPAPEPAPQPRRKRKRKPAAEAPAAKPAPAEAQPEAEPVPEPEPEPELARQVEPQPEAEPPAEVEERPADANEPDGQQAESAAPAEKESAKQESQGQ